MRTPLLSLIAFGMLVLPAPSRAQEQDGLKLPPAGQTIINLSATERRSIPQDLLVTSLRIEIEGQSPAAVQDKINAAMKKALDIARAEKSIKVSTGAYSIYKNDREEDPDPRDGKRGKIITVWLGSQTIEMQSKDSAKLLEVAGKLQELDFATNNLVYTLAPETIEAVQEELMIAALKKLSAKAEVVARTLGKSKADLVEVNVDNGGGPVVPVFRAQRADMAMMEAKAMSAPPVAEAGESDVSLTVSARALIKP